jgi:homoserine O-acetyltransferase
MPEFVPVATRFVELPARFDLKRGGALYGARIAYEASGPLNEARDNVILILTGLSADAHAASHPADPTPGWWEAMVGPGKPVDTDRWHVICVNSLGSCRGSTGPASVNPRSGVPYRLEFPELSVEDIADAAAFAVRALGVERLACVIGASMGAMSALALVARHPGLARNHINISGAVHSLPFSIAIRSVQREAIRFDPQWDQGRYGGTRYPHRGMVAARKLGMITYRSAEEWNGRFGRARSERGQGSEDVQFDPEFEVERYLERHAHRFAQGFDPNSYLYLSRCIDWFDLGESCGRTPGQALAHAQLDKALVIGVHTDILFPLAQQREIAHGLRAGGTETEFLPLDSQQGHDAFLVDPGRFGPPIARFLATPPQPWQDGGMVAIPAHEREVMC